MEANPKEIFIGMNCSKKHSEQLAEVAFNLNIPIYRMAFEECSSQFGLSIKKFPIN